MRNTLSLMRHSLPGWLALLIQGPCAAFLHERIAVGDFAAQQLASLLNLKVDVDSTWQESQWRALRRRVHAELAKPSKR